MTDKLSTEVVTVARVHEPQLKELLEAVRRELRREGTPQAAFNIQTYVQPESRDLSHSDRVAAVGLPLCEYLYSQGGEWVSINAQTGVEIHFYW